MMFPFVKVVNDMIHNYYKEQGVVITSDFEINDGCSSQFKSRTAIGLPEFGMKAVMEKMHLMVLEDM